MNFVTATDVSGSAIVINVASIAYTREFPDYTVVYFIGSKDHVLSVKGNARDLLKKANPTR